MARLCAPTAKRDLDGRRVYSPGVDRLATQAGVGSRSTQGARRGGCGCGRRTGRLTSCGARAPRGDRSVIPLGSETNPLDPLSCLLAPCQCTAAATPEPRTRTRSSLSPTSNTNLPFPRLATAADCRLSLYVVVLGWSAETGCGVDCLSTAGIDAQQLWSVLLLRGQQCTVT